MKPARGILVDFIALNNHTCHRSIYVLIKFILCERSLYERMILINTLNVMSLLCTKTALCHLYSQCLFKALSLIHVVKLEECHILFWNEFGYSILLCNINLATVLLQVFTSSRSWCSGLLSLLRHCRHRSATECCLSCEKYDLKV